MPDAKLIAYRRHLQTCPHRPKGQHYSLCLCPVWVYGTLSSGRPIRQSLGVNDWSRALERIEILRSSGEAAVAPRSRTLTIAIRDYLEDSRKRNLGAGTLRSYRITLEHFSKDRGTLPIASIDTSAINGFFDTRRIKPRTYGKELRHLRIFFSWCMFRKWISENPAKRIHPPKVEDVPNLPYTPEQTAKLIAACDHIVSNDPSETPYIRKRARALLLTFLYTGLRISDVARLRRAALDPETGHLTLRLTKTKTPLKVHLHPDAVHTLTTLPATNPEYFFWSGSQIESCIIGIRRAVYRIGNQAGIPANPHRLRDTFACALLANGTDIRTLQLLLGHSDVRTTERHYAHFMPVHQALLDRATATLNFQPKPARPVLMKTRQNRRRDS